MNSLFCGLNFLNFINIYFTVMLVIWTWDGLAILCVELVIMTKNIKHNRQDLYINFR